MNRKWPSRRRMPIFSRDDIEHTFTGIAQPQGRGCARPKSEFAKPAPEPEADVTISLRDEQNQNISGKLSKILWNCSTEGIVEFNRVVYDLFPRGDKQLRYVISDFVGKFLTKAWGDEIITREELLTALKSCEPPQASGDLSSCSILNGLLFALEALSEQTPLQTKALREYRKYLDHQQQQRNATSCSNVVAPRRVNVAELVKYDDGDDDSEEQLAGQQAFASSSCSSSLSAANLHSTSTCVAGASSSHEEGEIREMDDEPKQQQMAQTADSGRREPAEKRAMGAAKARTRFRLNNNGAIVVLTSIDSVAEYEAINDYVSEQVVAINQSIRNSVNKNRLFRINHVKLFVLNIVSDEKHFLKREKRNRPHFVSQLISVPWGVARRGLIAGVHKILQEIYGLVSTTVVGIPMKEETQGGQSVIYDVELLHPRGAHSMLRSHELLDKMLDSPTNHASLFRSVRLKWCTATNKLKSEMFPLLCSTFPITPAHSNSRPSMCLTSFLLNGKNVLLEVLPDAYQGDNKCTLEPNLQQKLISHYLSKNHSGSLIVHSVAIGEKATLGGRLCSEKVYGASSCSAELTKGLNRQAMLQLVQANQIVPEPIETFPLVERFDAHSSEKRANQQHENLRDNFLRTAGSEFPVKLSDSYIYNCPERFEPLMSSVSSQEISSEQFDQCQSLVTRLAVARVEAKEPLTDKTFACKLLSTGSTATAPREEQYRVAFEELCRMLSRFSHLSEDHRRLLQHFVEITGTKHPPAFELAGSHESTNQQRQGNMDDDFAMELRIKRRRAQVAAFWKPGEEVNLFDWWQSQYEKEYWTHWRDFEGRKKYGDKAMEHLYPGLKLPAGQSKGAGTGTAAPIE